MTVAAAVAGFTTAHHCTDVDTVSGYGIAGKAIVIPLVEISNMLHGCTAIFSHLVVNAATATVPTHGSIPSVAVCYNS
ncbi:uncharacterized protein VTP21DRAFT_10811 [Calcarisporiella thermophila]|uniref:uncharacterized protein n=1 Tax=Calcarisporiella thermophila TaxID=911321 RepID=UPI003742CD5B